MLHILYLMLYLIRNQLLPYPYKTFIQYYIILYYIYLLLVKNERKYEEVLKYTDTILRIVIYSYREINYTTSTGKHYLRSGKSTVFNRTHGKRGLYHT